MRSPHAHGTSLLAALLIAIFVVLISSTPAPAEQASGGARHAQGGFLDAGDEHTCAVLADRSLRCWGRGLAGRLGYGNEQNVLAAGAAGPVNLGPGRDARAVAAGDFHTCAILDDGGVRCWGFGANGRLGYGSTANVTSPAVAPPVDIGPGRRATAITAGASHTCAILDDGTVRCWGNGVSGRLGYGSQASIGDDEVPAAAGPVDIGPGRRAVAISAGDFHTCVIRDDGALVCWGFGSGGQLGYGNSQDVGDDETPGARGPVDMNGHAVQAVSGGKGHTCVVRDDGTVRCWGFGADGRLGYGSQSTILNAGQAGAVNLGPGRRAVAVSAGEAHSCAILDTGAVRCWGFGGNGRLGYGATDSIGDAAGETPASVAPVFMGAGRTARAISLGFSHTCALLDDATVSCWGYGGSGRLGYGDETSVGDSPGRSVASAGALPLPQVAPLVADLSLTLSATGGEVTIGTAATLVVTVVNSGPDHVDGVSVSLPTPAGLAFRSAAASQGAYVAPGVWEIGSLGPGAAATLTVAVASTATGSHQVLAEIASSSVLDPDSTPANGRPEDDGGSITFVVPQTTGVSNGRPRDLRPLPRRLDVKVARSPRRGVARRLTVSGRLVPPRGRAAARCAGRVQVRAKVGRRTVASRTVRLRTVRLRTVRGGVRARVCLYSAVLRPTAKRTRAARKVVVSARFLGTAQMRPRASRGVTVRIRPPARRR